MAAEINAIGHENNVTNLKSFGYMCPDQGAVFGDKGYCTKPARTTLARKGCFDATIRKRNMAGKNVEKDRWLSGVRTL